MKQSEIKYVVCPGYIQSKTDGQQHYISYNSLIRLYQVRRSECIRLDDRTRGLDGLIALVPRYNGDYIESLKAYWERVKDETE